DGEIAAETHVAPEVNAEGEDGVDFGFDEFARETEDGDADGEHAARFGVRFKDGDLVADLYEVVRDGEAGDAAADDRDFFVVAAIGREHALIAAGVVSGGAAAFRAEFIGDEAFEGADGDGGIDIAAAAVDFAGGAADASADG